MKNAPAFPFRSVAMAGLIAGTLDATAAIVLLAGMNAAAVFRFIASGVFGPAAFEGGADVVAWGVLFHYLIALFWAGLYFRLYPRLAVLRKNVWFSGIGYGIVVWVVMNLLVLPLTAAPQGNSTVVGVARGMGILVVCIGLPIAWLAARPATNQPASL